MLLKVIDVGMATAPRVVINEYAPIYVEWNYGPDLARYWRPGDQVRSLVEIGLDSQTGIICSLKVVTPGDRVQITDGALAVREGARSEGRPVCDMTSWANDRFVDVRHPFTLCIHRDSMSVWLCRPERCSSDLVAERVSFHLSPEREIIGFSVREINEHDVEQLRDTTRWLQRQR